MNSKSRLEQVIDTAVVALGGAILVGSLFVFGHIGHHYSSSNNSRSVTPVDTVSYTDHTFADAAIYSGGNR